MCVVHACAHMCECVHVLIVMQDDIILPWTTRDLHGITKNMEKSS